MAREEAEIKELTKKLGQNPDSLVFAPLADAHRRLGQLDEAIQICRDGLEKNPTYVTARVILGRSLMDKGEMSLAQAEFKKIQAADPQNVMAHSMIGQIAMEQQNFAEAVSAFTAVLAISPDDGSAQSMLDEALGKAKNSGADTASVAPVEKEAALSNEQMGSIKVAEIYLKKGALDEAEEVLNEILSGDPENPIAKQKLAEIVRRRGPSREDLAKEAARKDGEAKKQTEDKAGADEDAKRKIEEAREKAETEKNQALAREKEAEEAAKAADREKAQAQMAAKAAEQEAKVEAARKAAEEARAIAEAEKKKAEEARVKAEEERARAEEERKRVEEEQRKALEEKKKADEASKKAEEEARKKEAEDAARKKIEEEKRHQAEEVIRRKAEEAHKRAEHEAKVREEAKLSSDDILSVMQSGDEDELIGEDTPVANPVVPPSVPVAKTVSSPAPAAGDSGLQKLLEEFNRKNNIQGSLLLSKEGAVIVDLMSGVTDPATGKTASKIFVSTEKAMERMHLGNLEQIMIAGEDGRQILFVDLKQGVLVAITSSTSNVGLLRIAINDIKKKTASAA